MTPGPISTTPLQRLGHVLGWAGTAIAAVLVVAALWLLAEWENDREAVVIPLGAALIAYLVGRALRYIFAGK